MAPPYAGPVGPSSTAPGSPPSLGSSSGIQRQTGQPVTLPPTGPVGPASAIPGSFGASRLASAAGPPQGSPMPGSVPSSPSLAGHGYPPPMPHQQMPPPSPGQPQQPNALADLVPKTHRTVSMGRKKKIELFEKDEPSRTLPNYEFEKRKWDAYNELRQGASYRKAASQYNISYRCLFDYARGKRNRVESHERYMALPVELETELSNQIMGIVEQTGVFPQQKVISQLANELIRRSQNNPSASAAAGGPGGSPKSQGAGSSGSPGSDSAGSSTADPPVRPKPAVSDTWVSKFLRRHPELNYEKRTKRRKLDACVGTSPVVGSTDAGSGASSAKTRAGSISPSTSVEAVSSSSSSVSSSSHHHHSHLQQQAQQQHMVHHTVGGISGPPGVMHSAHQSPVMHHPQQQQQQQQQHLPHPNLMGGAPPQYAPGLAGMGRPVPATLPPITGQVPYIQGHPQQQQPQQQQPQQQQQQQQQQDQQQQPYPLPPIHSYPPQVQQQQQLTPQPQQQQMVPMSPAQQQRNMIHYNNNQYHNNYYYNQPPPQQQQPQHYSSSVHQPIQNNYYSSPNGAMQSKGHSSSPTLHQVAQQQPLPQQHQQQALQPMSHPQQPNQQLPTKAQQHQGLSPQQPPASPGRAKSLRRSNLQHWFNGLNRNIDSLSIRPGDIYNARVLNFKIDGGKCVVVRGGRVDEAWAESSSSGTASIFECICTDGTCLESVASVSGAGSRSLGSIPGVHVLGGVASRHEGLGFFEWLRGHFDRQTGSKANSSWRVLIIEECESIDLFHFLWAFKRRILIVTVPSSSARTIQPIERGSVIDLLCKRLKSSLKEYAHSRDGEGASGSKGSRSPASTSPQLENLVVNLRSPSRSNESSSSSTSLKSVFDLAGFLTTYGVVHGEAFTTDNIVSGWKQTGILPRNPNLVIDSVSKRDGCENGEKEEEDEEKDDEDDDDEEGEERAGEVLIDVSLEMNDSEEETIKESSKAVPLDGMGSLGAQRASPFKAVELLESGIEALEDPNLSGEERSQKLFSLLGQAFEDAVEWNLSRHMGASASLLRHLRRSSSDSASQAILEGAGGSARWSSEGREDGSEGEGVLILRQETVRGDGLRKKSTSKDGSEVEIKREEGSDEEYLRAGQGNGAATAGANGKGEEGTGGEEHADGREEKRGGDGEGEGEGGEDEESSLSRRREEQLMLPELSVELGTKIRRYLHPSWVSRERRRGRRAVSQTLRESVSGGGTTVEEGIITVEQVVTALLRFIESDGSRS